MSQQVTRSKNAVFTSGALTATGAETVYDTTVTITGSLDGKIITKTAVTDGATPTTDAVTGSAFTTLTANKGSVMVWCVNSSGTVKVLQGSVEDMSGGSVLQPPQCPNIPDTLLPFAYQVLKASSTAGTITFGTSNWSATGFTNAIVNVSVLPNRPQVS
jgi:hypothetical protein